MTRVADPNETLFSFATRKPAEPTAVGRSSHGRLEFLRRFKHYDMDAVFRLHRLRRHREAREAAAQAHRRDRAASQRHLRRLRSGRAVRPEEVRHPVHPRHLLSYGGVADVSETSAPWSVLPKLYDGVIEAAEKAFAELEVQGWIMCHLSHSYHLGMPLLHVRVHRHRPHRRARRVRHRQALDPAGVHGAGRHVVAPPRRRSRRTPWLEQDVSAPGVSMIRALFDGVDPGHQLNPGKIVPSRARERS